VTPDDGAAKKTVPRELLKRLRKERSATTENVRMLVRDLNQARKRIRGGLSAAPKTVPELSAAIDMPADEVLWHLMSMRRYGLVAEDEQDGDYFRYRLTGEETTEEA